MPQIVAHNLGYSFSSKTALKSLNFEINERRIGIIGRNGSGKSTLARIIAGLLKPTQGVLRVDGFDLYENRKEALQRVGIVFQNPDQQIIFPSVVEELKFGFSQQDDKNAEARAEAVLAQYDKTDWKSRLVADLSQGQRHFLALISILEMRPEILILDEPFTGLDIPSTMRLRKHLRAFRGMILHITHEPELLTEYDRVLWLEEGEIKADGASKKITRAYVSEMKSQGESDAYTGF